MIEFVTVENVNQFPGNALVAQHRLRYRSIIERQNWDVPNYGKMEFDQYDNPAAKYWSTGTTITRRVAFRVFIRQHFPTCWNNCFRIS